MKAPENHNLKRNVTHEGFQNKLLSVQLILTSYWINILAQRHKFKKPLSIVSTYSG